MSRVALGHTGRDIRTPPRIVAISLALLLVGAFFRVLLPLLETNNYIIWVGISQGLWIAAFTLFLFTYVPILYKSRIDGQPG